MIVKYVLNISTALCCLITAAAASSASESEEEYAVTRAFLCPNWENIKTHFTPPAREEITKHFRATGCYHVAPGRDVKPGPGRRAYTTKEIQVSPATVKYFDRDLPLYSWRQGINLNDSNFVNETYHLNEIVIYPPYGLAQEYHDAIRSSRQLPAGTLASVMATCYYGLTEKSNSEYDWKFHIDIRNLQLKTVDFDRQSVQVNGNTEAVRLQGSSADLEKIKLNLW